MANPYEVLGISPSATDDEVKKAYREMSRKYHPDSYTNNPLSDLAEEKFKEVQEAYDQIMKQRENGGYQGGFSGQQSGYSYSGNSGDANVQMQAVANYINARHYREALNVLNLKRENVIRKSAEELALKNDLLRRLIRELVTPSEQKEPLKIYADNKESYFKASYVPIINTEAEKDEPRKLGDVILLKNITEFKELDSAKTTFISTISHELKTPIAAIMMSLQLLEDKRVGALNDEQEQLSKSIKENSERLLGITGELLNMTQVEAGKLQLMPKITKPIELIEYAIKANQVQADKFNIQIEVEYPEEKIGKLFVDSEKIAWVLTNLLSNAIRYSKENGRVVIGAKQEDNIIELYVQDFGKGIDPRYHKSIFDRYFRVPGTKVQGSGLGLSISRDFVEAHGGTLTVESELGKGSRFVIRLKA